MQEKQHLLRKEAEPRTEDGDGLRAAAVYPAVRAALRVIRRVGKVPAGVLQV